MDRVNNINIYFGDSHFAPLASPPAVNGSAPWLLAFKRDETFENHALSGAMAADQGDAINAFVPGATKRAIYSIGTNDARHSGGAAGKISNFRKIISAQLYLIGGNVRVFTDASFTKSAGWYNNAPWTKGVASKIAGNTISGSFSGDELVIGYTAQDTAGGQFTVSVDGVYVGTVINRGDTTIMTALGRAYAPMLARFAGFGAGSHSFVLTQNQGGKYVYLDWIFDGPSGFEAYVLSIPKMTAAGYAAYGGSDAIVAAFNAVLADEVAAASGLGCNVTLITPSIDLGLHLGPDGVHFNEAGQAVRAAAIDAAIP